MVEAFEQDPSLSLVAPKLCYETQGIFYPDFPEASQYAGIAACIAMRKKILEPLSGFFDESYGVFFEDTDFFVRMRHAGLKFRYLPEAVVTHRDRSIRQNNEAVYYLQIRNCLYALRKLSGFPRFPHELSWRLYAKYLVFGLLNYAWFNDWHQKGNRTYGEKILSKLRGPQISRSPLWPLLILATIFRSWLWNLTHSPPLTRLSKSA
jgi:GT2 family glycosyltransferase